MYCMSCILYSKHSTSTRTGKSQDVGLNVSGYTGKPVESHNNHHVPKRMIDSHLMVLIQQRRSGVIGPYIWTNSVQGCSLAFDINSCHGVPSFYNGNLRSVKNSLPNDPS